METNRFLQAFLATSATIVLLGMLVLSARVAAEESGPTANKKVAGSGTRAKVKQVYGATDVESKRPRKIVKSDKEWRKQLSRKQYEVTRKAGTERAFTGRYWRHKAKGTYQCVCCQLDLLHPKQSSNPVRVGRVSTPLPKKSTLQQKSITSLATRVRKYSVVVAMPTSATYSTMVPSPQDFVSA